MQKLTKFLALLLVSAVVIVSSCKKDEDTTFAPKEDAQQVLENASTQLAQDTLIMGSDGVVAMKSLSNLNAPMIGSLFGDLGDFGPKSLKLKRVKTIEADTAYGTFTYKPDLCGTGCPGWEYLSSPTTALVFVFPTVKDSSNNATLTISDYAEQEFTGTDDEDYPKTWTQPTKLVFDLKVDDVTQVEVDFQATWGSDGEPITIALDAYLNPYDIAFNWNVSGSTVNVDLSIKQGSTTMIAADLSATFEGVAMEDAPVDVSGYIQYGTLKLEGSINIKGLEEYLKNNTNPTADGINSNFNLSLYENTAGKLGDFVFKEISGELQMVFVYGDGTVANEDFTNKLTALVNGMFK